MVITENPRIASMVRRCAIKAGGDQRLVATFRGGYNYRLAEMNCALGISQMKRIDAMLARRAEIAGKYHDN